VAEAVAYFEVVREHWDELRPGAKHPTHCPNTRENFMFELAEGLMVLERGSEARPIYEELTQITTPRTRAKELIAHVASERLRNFDDYLGEMRLMPPWPSDVGNCVVCHAWSSDVGFESLYTVETISLADVPSQAQFRPITPGGEIAKTVPEDVAELIERECGPCHFAGGEVVDLLDLSDASTIQRQASSIASRVDAGEMPPDGGLDEQQRALLRAWVDESP
jgi:hypothetical protein